MFFLCFKFSLILFNLRLGGVYNSVANLRTLYFGLQIECFSLNNYGFVVTLSIIRITHPPPVPKMKYN